MWRTERIGWVWSAMLVGLIPLAADAHKVTITVEKPEQVVEATKPPFEGRRAAVDVAILLDTSNSMDGLISQAKSQLWTIVQQFAKAQKNGQTPKLRVALLEYGNTRLPASEGYIRQVVPLTNDLDKLSEALFVLTTSGGDEYCGQVIDEALTRLDWSKENNGYKAIFIAGNEPFTQGPVDYNQACKRAIENGVIVNTIHCGAHGTGVNGKWRDGAQLAEGEFFNIDQDRQLVHIDCPQDEIIIKLNAKLNQTYLWYGDQSTRRQLAANQVAQDANAAAESKSVAVSRFAVKGCPTAYCNQGRCIVDTYMEDADILTKVDESDLPEALQKMAADQREAFVKAKLAERTHIQEEIGKLATERDAYLKTERARRAEAAGEATLGDVVVMAVQKQLVQSGFETE
ncbi:MAG: vWA domain-containing protein [Planctomycetota bacterium]